VLKHYPANVTACIFWLKNRLPAEWRDRREEHHTVVQDNRTAAEILAELKRDMAEMGMDLVVRDDSSFALPRVLPGTGVTPGRAVKATSRNSFSRPRGRPALSHMGDGRKLLGG